MLTKNQKSVGAFAWLMLTAVPCAVAAQDQPAPQGSALSLGTLILSGERSERTLTDTYVGVTVLDEDRLEKTPATHTHEVLASTPNLFVEGKSELPTLRGVQGPWPGGSALTGLTGAVPRLAFVIDGVTRPAAIPFSSGFSLWDVEQVKPFCPRQDWPCADPLFPGPRRAAWVVPCLAKPSVGYVTSCSKTTLRRRLVLP